MRDQHPTIATESIILQSNRTDPPDLRLLHYNDVYHIEAGSAEPVGGVARFCSVVDEYRHGAQYKSQPDLLTFFSGDAFNPSLESSVTKGKHMVPFLNAIGTDVACVGNHDLDFGIAQFRYLRDQCKFPWLLANVLDPALGENVPLAGCDKTAILVSSNGVKIGVIGLAEREWLDTVNALPPDLIYKSASATAAEIAPTLREQGCELIIAETHMREPNDIKLAEKTPPGTIDLILGGHDHYYALKKINSTYVIRSGTDFKQLSYIEAWRKEGHGWGFSITRRDMVRSIPEDASMIELAHELTAALTTKLEQAIGYTAVPLDGRFTTVRTRESNLGNFVCDLMRFYYHTDCALMAAGTIRGDQIYSPGPIRLKDIMNCFPFEDPVVVLRLSGKRILGALESSVSLVPALEGRFPQVSNMVFSFNPGGQPGKRILQARINGQVLDPKRRYVMATRGYMARGKDGYVSLMSAENDVDPVEEVVSEENGILISTILRQYFMSLKIVGKWRRFSPSLRNHWGGVVKGLEQTGTIKEPRTRRSSTTSSRPSPKATRDSFSSGAVKEGGAEAEFSSGHKENQRSLTLASERCNGEDPTCRTSYSTQHRTPLQRCQNNSLSTGQKKIAVAGGDIDQIINNSDSDTSDDDQIPPPTPLSAHPLFSPSTVPPTASPAVSKAQRMQLSQLTSSPLQQRHQQQQQQQRQDTPSPEPATPAESNSNNNKRSSGPNDLSSSPSSPSNLPTFDPSLSDHLFHLARFYSRRWMTVAGIKREGVGMVDEICDDSEELPMWTRGIAPRVEGRIEIVPR